MGGCRSAWAPPLAEVLPSGARKPIGKGKNPAVKLAGRTSVLQVGHQPSCLQLPVTADRSQLHHPPANVGCAPAW